jgi:hypothetical protein
MKFKAFFFIIFLFSQLALAQTNSNDKQSEAARLWKMRSEFATNDITKDIEKLNHQDKVLYYSRLGDVWWKQDKVEGKIWLDKATDIVLSPATDFKTDKDRLEAIRNLLKIITSKDEILSKKLIKKLSEITENSNQDEIKNNGEALVESAYSIADNDPQKAFNLGISAIKLNKPVFSFFLYWKLHKLNIALADNYFEVGVNRIQVDTENTFLIILQRTAFPELMADFSTNPKPKPNDLLRKKFLDVVANYLKIEADEILSGKLSSCQKTWVFDYKMNSFFAQLLPEKLPILLYAQEMCEKTRSQSTNELVKNLNELKTIEDFLSAAEKTDDQKQKDSYKLSAARIAVEQKKFTQAIEILEDISEDFRKTSNSVWENYHLESWAGHVVQLFENNEITLLYDEIKKSPEYIRAELYLALSQKCSKEKNRQIGYEFLNTAMKVYEKKDFEPYADNRIFFDNPVYVMSATLGYAKLGYDNETLESYSVAVKSLNKFINKIPSEERRERIAKLPFIWENYVNFPELYFETYFQNITIRPYA